MRTVAWCLCLVACLEPVARDMPPPPVLRISALAPSEVASFTLETGVPGARVALLRSSAQPEPGPCPPILRGACVGLAAPRVVADVYADGGGVARGAWVVGGSVGDLHTFQAVALLPGGPRLTPPVIDVGLHPWLDDDLDGLTVQEEVAAGLDPRRPDTDGGGTIDGQELDGDRTDPLDPHDDVAWEADCFDHADGDGDGASDCRDPDCACMELCDQPADEDRNGLASCSDPACAGHPACTELCNDGVDNDLDGLRDGRDPDCAMSALWERACADGADDDGDGATDCVDRDCLGQPGCPASGEACGDGVDNDGDRLVDCLDSACRALSVCTEVCLNGVDDDQDRAVDCDDPDCRRAAGCVEDCHDGIDNDGDGLLDCADGAACRCREICLDGVDNDGDQLVDCADRACFGLCFERCGNGLDDDADGRVDCDDLDCAAQCRESCRDRVDNDGDGSTDCLDGDCWGRCAEQCSGGRDEDKDGRVDCADPDCDCVERCDNAVDDDQDGLTDCADADCGAGCGEVCDNGADDDHDGLVDCEDGGCTDLCTEMCGNGVDDDGDLWVDCQDEECWGTGGCPAGQRVAWVVTGSLRTRRVAYERPNSNGCDGLYYGLQLGTASDVRGMLKVAYAGREEVCTWGVDRARFSYFLVGSSETQRSSWWTSQGVQGRTWCSPGVWADSAVERLGVHVAPGCGTSGSAFLPTRLRVPPGAVRIDLAAGGPWYQGGVGVVSSTLDLSSFAFAERFAPFGFSESGMMAPLEPADPFGTCGRLRPTLVPDLSRLGGVTGVCLP